MTNQEPDERAVRHLPLAGRLVREVLRRTPAELVEDDLYAAALAALVAADADFDPEHDAPYERYVTARVREGMVEELASLDWSTHDASSMADRTAAARTRMDAALDGFGDRTAAVVALRGEAPAEPPTEATIADLPYLRAALADLPPHPDGTPVDLHLLQAESLAVLRASLMAWHQDGIRAISGLDAVTAAVQASRMGLTSGRVELDVAEHLEPADAPASAHRSA